MPTFDKDDYLRSMADMESLKGDSAAGAEQAGKGGGTGAESRDTAGPGPADGRDGGGTDSSSSPTSSESGSDQTQTQAQDQADGTGSSTDGADQDETGPEEKGSAGAAGSDEAGGSAATDGPQAGSGPEDGLTPLGQAKKEAADYLEALQRERAEFVNYRNRSAKEQERFRQHGIIDVLTALLPALDDIDRIEEHGALDDSFKAVATKIDKAFQKFGVEKFGQKGEDFDPTKHEAILHRPDPSASKETVDTVVEAGYRIGDRVIRAARVVVASPEQ